MKDSTQETQEHINHVTKGMGNAAMEILRRGLIHDASKLQTPEKEIFDEYTDTLKSVEYGSDEYKELLDKIKPALDHHYSVNDHHPQFWDNGVQDMDLFSLIEMLVDWNAAVKRGKDGDIYKSIEHNADRFDMKNIDLAQVFKNTVDRHLKNIE